MEDFRVISTGCSKKTALNVFLSFFCSRILNYFKYFDRSYMLNYDDEPAVFIDYLHEQVLYKVTGFRISTKI
jgi:hypothetical protein